MPRPDKLIELASEFLEARRPFVALANTCPQWSQETESTFHHDRNAWIENNQKVLNQLSIKAQDTRRALLVRLLYLELRLDEEQRDVSASEGIAALAGLLNSARELERKE